MTQLLIIVLYLSLLVVLGTLANRMLRGTSRDYMLASSSIGPLLLLMSLFGTTMTAFALVGSTGRAYSLGVGVYGLLASASGIVHSLCFFLIGVRLWAIGLRNDYRTQIQFFRERLDNNFVGLLLFPILVALVVSYLLLGVVAAGAIVQSVTEGAFAQAGWFAGSGHGVPAPLGSAVICLVVLTYVFFGGMRGTAWANAFQTTVFMVLGVVTFFLIAQGLGGSDSFLANLQAASAQVAQENPANLSREKISPAVWFSFLFIPLSVAMFPHVFQHWLTARNARAFRLPIVMHPIFIMIVWAPCVMVGVWASAPSSGIPPGTDENVVLGLLVKSLAGPLMGGLLTAGILAAIMSSLDSQFLCVGTMFTEDVVAHYMGKGRLSDAQQTWLARTFVAAVVAVTFLLSLYPRAVFDLGLWSFSGFAGLFPLVFAAVYWRRLTAAGGIASVLAVLASWSWLFYRSDFGANKKYAFPEDPLALSEQLVIPPMLPVVTVFACAAAALVLVSLFTKPPDNATLARFFPPR